MSQSVRIPTALCLALAIAAPAGAQIVPPDPEPPVAIPEPPAPITAPDQPEEADRAESLDALFAALASSGEQEWQPLQQQIMAVWARSESPSMTLLLGRATKAMQAKDYDKALGFLDDLVRLQPDFAEGWNRRATVHFLMENYLQSVADIQRTLALEPRHFGALAGLGLIYMAREQWSGALKAFEKAAEVNPWLKDKDAILKRLREKVDGRPL